MGMTAYVHQITPHAFLAIQRGDEDGFAAGVSTARADLDKTWHAIHYLLTGSSDLAFLDGGIQFPGVSEPFEAHSPETVARLCKQVEGASASTLLAKYDADDFNAREIYPGQWDEIGPDYIRPYLQQFLVVVREAAEVGDGIAVLLA
jgi:hypothetical protein